MLYAVLIGSSHVHDGNGGLHFDESLGNLGRLLITTTSAMSTTSGYSRYSWRDVTF